MKVFDALKHRIKSKMRFWLLGRRSNIFLYAGDVPTSGHYAKFIGLSLWQSNVSHIVHDITERIPLRDGCVDVFQAEDVLEHIEQEKVLPVIDEVYRVLKEGGVFRLSVPDYRCDVIDERTVKDRNGQILFDPGGGGEFVNGKVVGGGHLWFPTYEKVKEILEASKFSDIKFYHYYDEAGNGILNPIDYGVSFVKRTPDHDKRVQKPYRPLSIVVDCQK